ncbi:DUF2798 domain-containing protein [Vibrio sp. CAU 1672]|uniref:DUF2798 domain-containing protein n=1 Tax=Vibrio sp. CAU 1672 TaxID=3032594 RepID=UPI0023DAF969|nr:DUF2798 domain-containing protein [Vibrio sp. CAU 1672]MDF2155234.1 DUF2798 domain-containing protein [Vibrio sp. CAU 1672]
MSRKQFWISSLLSSLTMALIMSGVLSGYRLGFNAEWPPVWLESFSLAWPCALLLNLTVLPQVRRLSAWLATSKAISQA